MAYYDAYDVRFSDDGIRLIRCPESFSGSYEIPLGVERIASGAFKNCKGLTSLTIPVSVLYIEKGAFEGVNSLSNIFYQGNLNAWFSISHDAFINSPHALHIEGKRLREAVIPESWDTVPPRVFYYVNSLRSVRFHDKVVEIGESAFNKSSIDGVLTIPASVERIGVFAFLSCQLLTRVIIPKSVKSIGTGAFRYCSSVEEYLVDDDNPNYRNLVYDLYTKNFDTLLAVGHPKKKVLQSQYKVHSGVKQLPDYIFSDFPESVKMIILPDDLPSMTKLAFDGYKGKIQVSDECVDKMKELGFDQSSLLPVHDYNRNLEEKSKLVEFISNNPFRILGLPARQRLSDINKRASEILGILSQGKEYKAQVDDIPGLLPLERNLRTVRGAQQRLQEPMNRLIYSLFWCALDEEESDDFIRSLCAGDWDEAGDCAAGTMNDIFYAWLSKDHINAINSYLDFILYNLFEDVEGVVKEFVPEYGPSYEFYEIRDKLFGVLLDIYDYDTLMAFLTLDRRKDSEDVMDVLESLHKAAPADDFNSALEKSRNALEDYDSQLQAAIALREFVENHLLKEPQDDPSVKAAIRVCGSHIFKNAQTAYNQTTDRAKRLRAFYVLFDSVRFADPSDVTTVYNDEYQRVQKQLDVIPGENVVEQDCRIYSSITLMLIDKNIDDLYKRFLPIIPDLYAIKIEPKHPSPDPLASNMYYGEESDFIAEMTSNAVIRILHSWIKGKDAKINTLSEDQLRQTHLAYNLLRNIEKAFDLGPKVKGGILKKTIGSTVLFLTQNGQNPQYSQMFSIASEDEHWRLAKQSPTALLAFNMMYGLKTKHAPEISALFKKFEQEDERMWKGCKTKDDYENYLKKTPYSIHRQEAIQIIKQKSEKLKKYGIANVLLIILAIVLFILLVK